MVFCWKTIIYENICFIKIIRIIAIIITIYTNSLDIQFIRIGILKPKTKTVLELARLRLIFYYYNVARLKLNFYTIPRPRPKFNCKTLAVLPLSKIKLYI